jgi:hypothetical protein
MSSVETRQIERDSLLLLALLRVDGSVAWKQDDRFGIALVEEIDPKLARAPVAAGAPDLASPRYTRPPLDSSTPVNLRKI